MYFLFPQIFLPKSLGFVEVLAGLYLVANMRHITKDTQKRQRPNTPRPLVSPHRIDLLKPCFQVQHDRDVPVEDVNNVAKLVEGLIVKLVHGQ